MFRNMHMISASAKKILDRVQKNISQISDAEAEKFLEEISKSKRIFVEGAGRSGLMGRSFAMRLMHLGFDVHVVGDTVTPAIRTNDLMIAISGSGETNSVKLAVEAAKKHGARVLAITGNVQSSIGRMATRPICIPTTLKQDKGKQDYLVSQLAGVTRTMTPLGTVFELSAAIFCDAVIAELMDRLNISEEQMKTKHTNIE